MTRTAAIPNAVDLAATLPPDRAAALRRVERIADLLDAKFKLPILNYPFGYDSLIGLIPGIGDAATATISLYLVFEARRAGAGGWTIFRMLYNVGVDALFGSIPILGDIFDFAFKANQANLKLLRGHLERQSLSGL